ncbi:MAG: NAD-glutamate dehydrogenase domain-containing protein, partial [Burkholderiales bacterium]
MATSPDALKKERIDTTLELVRAKVPAPESELVQTFAELLYALVDPEDLIQRSPDDLYGAALSLWRYAGKRAPGSRGAKVRVLNPTIAEHGWTSRHTVIEVVNDDMPFLVDTATMEINRQGLTLHLIIHPVMAVARDSNGELKSVAQRGQAEGKRLESVMHIQVDRVVDPEARDELTRGIEKVLGDVRAAVTDWQPMVDRLRGVIAELELEAAPKSVPPEEAAEARAFLEWIADDKLLLLGYRQHDLVKSSGGEALQVVAGSGLGVLRDSGSRATSGSFAELTPQARALAHDPSPIVIVTKANSRSTVHRPGYTDYVGIKRYDASGAVVGEHRFLGLLASAAYAERAAATPLIRSKVAAVIQRAGFAPSSHYGKALVHVLESYPRDELFNIGVEELHDTATGILRLGERQRLRLFLRREPFERFVSCLIYVPRDGYSTELRYRFIDILTKAFNGTGSEFDVLLSDAILARIHITIRTTPGSIPDVDGAELETRLTAASRRWEDDLRDALIDDAGDADGMALAKRFAHAFPASYREHGNARAAVPDVRKMAALSKLGELALGLYRAPEAAEGRLGFKLYHMGAPIVLSDSLPMLENMGVRVMTEAPSKVTPEGGPPIWIHDIDMQVDQASEMDMGALAPLVEDAFAQVFAGQIENDRFNSLVLGAGLAAEEVVILRAYSKYMHQIGFTLSQRFVEGTLVAQPAIARMLVQLFKLRFDPKKADDAAAEGQGKAIEEALDKVANLSEDRVLRQYLGLIRTTLRTNFWRTGVGASGEAGPRRPFLSFKIDSRAAPGLPDPRPLYEIFVYSPRFEGIHLRGGMVARGGLRWSDRPEDFRTEVL